MTLARLPEYTQTKAGKTEDVSIQGNISTDDSVRMSVSAEGTAHIMSLLTDLYSDPNLAVLREYASNAYDSHQAAGQSEPVKVSLPSSLSPVYVVEDFGTGMSADDIRYIYSSYGASTKRNDFNQVGAFGLGCKSALTLTQSFTLNSVKNGRQTVAIISRDEDGVGSINVVSEQDTDKPNGVKVSIPIPDQHVFNRNAENFFFTWPAGSVLVDDKEPVSLDTKNYKTSKSGVFRYLVTQRYVEREGLTVIMGGIGYPVSTRSLTIPSSLYGARTRTPEEIVGYFASRISLVSEVPIGSIDLTPSREAIRYSDRTKKFLSNLYGQICREFVNNIHNEISGASTRQEALDAADMYQPIIRNMNNYRADNDKIAMQWRGEDVPTNFEYFGTKYSITHDIRTNYGKTSSVSSLSDQVDNPGTDFHVVGSGTKRIVFVAESDKDIRRKIANNFKYYLHSEYANPYDVELFVLESEMEDKWVLENTHYDFDDSTHLLEKAAEYRKANRKTPAAPGAAPAKVYEYTVVTKNAEGVLERLTLPHTDLVGHPLYVIERGDTDTFDKILSQNYGYPGKIKMVSTLVDLMGLEKDAHIVILPRTWSVAALEKRTGGQTIKNLKALAREKYDKLSIQESIVLEATNIFRTPYGFGVSALHQIQSLSSIADELPDPEFSSLLEIVDRARTYYNTVETFINIFRFSIEITSSNPSTEGLLENRIRKLAKTYPLLNLGEYSKGLDKMQDHAMLYITAVHSAKTKTERTS